MNDDDFISKTRRKREATELQGLGAALVKLGPEELARIRMPETLRDAVVACQGYTKHEAIRRQLQYIGKIMRDLDAAPIAEQVTALHAPSRRQTALFHAAEKWRDELLAEPEALLRFEREFPGVDGAELRRLVESARAERDALRPPKHSRALFHVINAAVQQAARQP